MIARLISSLTAKGHRRSFPASRNFLTCVSNLEVERACLCDFTSIHTTIGA
jgi:hypothetical protein